MISSAIVLQAYAPHLDLGDWQIVVAVNRKRGRISIERWHSSEPHFDEMASAGQTVRILTGIRAFRRQMPILAAAVEKIAVRSKPMEEIVQEIFGTLKDLYQAGAEIEEIHPEHSRCSDGGFDEFFELRKAEALAALASVRH